MRYALQPARTTGVHETSQEMSSEGLSNSQRASDRDCEGDQNNSKTPETSDPIQPEAVSDPGFVVDPLHDDYMMPQHGENWLATVEPSLYPFFGGGEFGNMFSDLDGFPGAIGRGFS